MELSLEHLLFYNRVLIKFAVDDSSPALAVRWI
jgi:hypothetical protein